MFCPHCGKEINNNADICLGCGRSVKNITRAAEKDSNNVGWWWLGFFFPLIGFILWLVWTGDTPMRAKRAGMGALVGVIVSVALVVISYIAIIALSVAVGVSFSNMMYL